MRVAGQSVKRKAPLCGGAFLLVFAAAAIGVGAATASAQTQPSKNSSAKSSTAKGSAAKPQTRRRAPVRRARGQTAPTAERIKEIQAALGKAGHYSGEPTGKWDANTVAALKQFQESKGMKPTGKLSARTLQELGFPSDTAGLAPPRKTAAADSGTSQ